MIKVVEVIKRRPELDVETFQRHWLSAITSTEEFAAAKQDEPNFVDLARLIELVVDEHVIKDGPIPDDSIKNIEFINLSPALGPQEAHRYWREVHGPIAARIPTMSHYVQSHVRTGAYDRPDPPVFDGVAVTWWEDLDAMRASAAGKLLSRPQEMTPCQPTDLRRYRNPRLAGKQPRKPRRPRRRASFPTKRRRSEKNG